MEKFSSFLFLPLLGYISHIIKFTCLKCTVFKFFLLKYSWITMLSVVFTIFKKLYNHHYNLILEYFENPSQNPSPKPVSQPSHPICSPRQLLIYFMCPWICLFWTFHINGIIQYVLFCDWILPHSLTFARFIHVYLWGFFGCATWVPGPGIDPGP